MTKANLANLLKLSVFGLLSLPLAAQFRVGAPAPNCGTYKLVQWIDGTFSCERFGAFPWYAAGAGWKSQIPSFVTPVALSSGQNRGVRFAFGFGTGSSFFALFGGPYGSYTAFSVSQPIVVSNYAGCPNPNIPCANAVRLDINAGADCATTPCGISPSLAYGPMWIQIDAPDVQTLEAASLQLIYLYSDPAFLGANTSQVAVPPVFYDQLKSKWISSFSETSLDQKGVLNSNNMSFAVTNLSGTAQKVKVSLYDLAGNKIVEKETPELPAAPLLNLSASQIVSGGFHIPGGVHGDSFSSFFGLRTSMLTPASAQTATRMGTIDGTIRFEGSAGGPVAPLVVRMSGQSNTVLLVTPFD